MCCNGATTTWVNYYNHLLYNQAGKDWNWAVPTEVAPTAHCWQIHHPPWVPQHHQKQSPLIWGPQTFHGQPGFSDLWGRNGILKTDKLQWPWSEWPLCRTCPLSPAAGIIRHGKSPKDMRNASLNRTRAQTQGNIEKTENNTKNLFKNKHNSWTTLYLGVKIITMHKWCVWVFLICSIVWCF